MSRTVTSNSCNDQYNHWLYIEGMKTFSTRLIALREALGLNQSELGRRIGVSPQAVQKWESGANGPRGQRLEKLASELRTTVGYLVSGEGDSTPNVEPGPEQKGFVPLISWVRAGSWCEVEDIYAVGDAEDWLPCPTSHGPRTYVLRVRGESMNNPHARKTFRDGDLIYCDPDRQAENGSMVVVKLDDEQQATFKQLIIEGEQKFLKALNPNWPEPIIKINGNATICGVVIGKYEAF